MIPLFLFALPISIFAQSTPTVLCIPGQCLQGYSNITIGAELHAPNVATSVHLLPGQYTSSTNPQLLHDILTSSPASLAPSPGFQNSTPSTSLPLNLALSPGLAIYANTLYGGQSSFTALPSTPRANTTSTPLSASSLSLSSNTWAALSTGSNSSSRLILWSSVPSLAQLPGNPGSLALLDLQGTACSPACSGAGTCTSAGTCVCAPNFTGTACETCAPGFFGPSCQACSSDCAQCDEGITGSGRCLKPIVSNAPATCNCLNGVCGSNGQCTCNAGFTTAANGTACAKCASGFFLTSTGDCQVCQLGCTQCADLTGVCTACKSGFSQDGNDRTKCNAPPSVTSSGTTCPDGSFANGASCTPCSSSCETCSGGTANDCIVCAQGLFALNGQCVSADADGVCAGSNLIADNNKHECDSCGAKCTSCKIPSFGVTSTVSQLQCTGCLPGSVLSNGKCIDSCPSGTFISPTDNLTCQACDSSCTTCTGSSTFCLSCPSSQLASSGKCVPTCPSGTFPSASGTCLPCHPDCLTCSSSSTTSSGTFNTCTSCPASRPVLSSGRCLPTCAQSQFLDPTSGTCQPCDASCSSCSAAGPASCLACSSASQVLRGGTCTTAPCTSNTTVVLGLGACLSELIDVPKVSGTSTAAPLPTITGLDTPTASSTRRASLEWWQILLMALGCAFIFLVFIWCCRRRQRKQRAKKTAMFAAQGGVVQHNKSGWRWRLLRFGEKLFGHTRSRKRVIPVVVGHPAISHPYPSESESIKLTKLRAAEEARTHDEEEDMVQLIGSYQYARPPTPPVSRQYLHPDNLRHERRMSDASAPSIYSQMTGVPRRMPDPRQPVKGTGGSRFSTSTGSSEGYYPPPVPTRDAAKNPFWR